MSRALRGARRPVRRQYRALSAYVIVASGPAGLQGPDCQPISESIARTSWFRKRKALFILSSN